METLSQRLAVVIVSKTRKLLRYTPKLDNVDIVSNNIPPAVEALRLELEAIQRDMLGKQFVIEMQQEILAKSIYAHRQMVKRKNEVKQSIDTLIKLEEIKKNEPRNREQNNRSR